MEHKNLYKTPCSLDQSLSCSPDCKNISKDGHTLAKKCIETGCEEIKHILDLANATEQEILEKYGEKIYFK